MVGYDGFLYSIGFLAGWVVALFLIAEPMKRLGKYTFTDALNAKFNNRGITLVAAISTLVISIFYLIPQMVGAGDLVTPLLGFPHWVGVVLVGIIVIFIVATAGMTSTTYVQFIKGGLLIIFSTILAVYIFNNGLNLKPSVGDMKHHEYMLFDAQVQDGKVINVDGYQVTDQQEVKGKQVVKLEKDGIVRWFHLVEKDGVSKVSEMLSIAEGESGKLLYNGEPKENGKFFQVGHMSKIIVDGKEVEKTGPIGPFKFLSTIESGEVVRFTELKFKDNDKKVIRILSKYNFW